MDLCRRMKSVKSYQNYLDICQDTEGLTKCLQSQNIQFNMSTLLALKNVRSFEIEYFKKCGDSGVAFKILRKMVQLPASKTWELLGKELISIIQFWLEAVRKHLITQNVNWWLFLTELLGFIKQLHCGSPSLSNGLVEGTAEILLDLATHGKLSVTQRHAVLHTFNLYSADCTREKRLGLKTRFEHYFIRLAAIMSSCGHVPTQYSILETLLRWLQPRQDLKVRRDAVAQWFPPHLYRRSTTLIFLERDWRNFFQDTRDFLNAHNSQGDLITSAICRKISVGNIILLSGSERRQTWVDINSATRSMSVLLDPGLLEAAGCPGLSACEALVVSADNAALVKLHRESVEIKITAVTTNAPEVQPSNLDVFSREREVSIVISSRNNLLRVDNALRTVFDDKYQVLVDFDNLPCLSPLASSGSIKRNSHEQGTRFSNPVKDSRHTHAGYAKKSRRPLSCMSPSTTSTTSLAQLHDRVAASESILKNSNKEPVKVCIRPELSDVSEIAESEASPNITTNTFKLRQSGYCRMKRILEENRNSQSDGELTKCLNTLYERVATSRGSHSDIGEAKGKDRSDGSNNMLIAATLGSAEDSVISATIEFLPKNKEITSDNLAELLAKEALQYKSKESEIDSGINNEDEKQGQEEFTKNIHYADGSEQPFYNKTHKSTVVSKSTSDESNTEAISDTPMCYVSTRKKNLRNKSVSCNDKETTKVDPVTFDVKDIENFFSQHFTENKAGDLIISPTLAKKINETSSDTSEDLDHFLDSNVNVNLDHLHDNEIIECLNSMLDTVCKEFEKCSQYFDQEPNKKEIIELAAEPEKEPLLVITNMESTNTVRKTQQKPKGNMKLRYGMKKPKGKSKKTNNKLPLEPVSKMDTILEVNTETDVSKRSTTSEVNIDTKKNKSLDNGNESVVKRRRKLYSPKNDHVVEADEETSKSDDISLADIKKHESVTPKSMTFYSEWEERRGKNNRKSTRKLRSNDIPLSPKTKKNNDVFDHLKENVENNEKIILVDMKSDKDISVFNFTSDSEDDDFKQKKIELKKITSTTTIASGNSLVSTRRGRKATKIMYTEDDKGSSTDTNKKPTMRRKRTKGTSRAKRPVKQTVLEDERMRDGAPETLDTSFVVNTENVKIDSKDSQPKISVPEIEVIPDDNLAEDVETTKTNLVVKQKSTNNLAENVETTKTNLVVKQKSTNNLVENVETVNTNLEVKQKSKNNKQKKKTEKILTIKKEKLTSENVQSKAESIKDDDRTISPLPGLIIETVREVHDASDTLTSNMEQKFKRIFQEGPDACNETNTTQNMLSDIERISTHMNIDEEINRIEKEIGITDDNKNHFSIPDDVEKVQILDIDFEEGPKTDESIKSKKRSLRLKNKESIQGSIIDNSISKDIVEKKSKYKKLKDTEECIQNYYENKSNKPISVRANENKNTCMDTEFTSRPLTFNPDKAKQIEVTVISDVTEMKSEKSIATVGITAHGDFDELPPSYEEFDEILLPREAEDMDASMRQYFLKLQQQIILNHSGSSKSKEGLDNLKSTKRSIKTAAVLKPSESSKRVNTRQRSRNSSNSSADKCLSPSITKISLKDIEKWLPSRRRSSSSEKSVTDLRRDDLRKWLPSPRSTTSKTSEKSTVKSIKKPNNKTDKFLGQEAKRRSVISPIKLFDESISSNTRYETKNTSKNDTSISRNTETTQKGNVKNLDKSVKYFTRSVAHRVGDINSSRNSKISKNDDSGKSPVKRKGDILKNYSDVKKTRAVGEIDVVVISESGPSVSSVDEWFKRNTLAVDKAEKIGNSVKDIVQNVIERLDTTLAEIHQNTSNDFVHLFMDTQKELSEMKAQVHEDFKETATNMLNGFAEIIDKEFTALDNKFKERSSQFAVWLKQHGIDFIKQDSRRKHSMTELLREDAQAVLDHLNEDEG